MAEMNEKMQKLLEKKRKIDNEIKSLERAEKEKARKADAHTKIVHGVVVINALGQLDELQRNTLQEYLNREDINLAIRKELGLPPKEKADN